MSETLTDPPVPDDPATVEANRVGNELGVQEGPEGMKFADNQDNQ